MRCFRTGLFVLFLLCLQQVPAQYFELEQVNQLFRPRVVWDASWQDNMQVADSSGSFSFSRTGISGTVPLVSRLEAEVKPDFSSMKWRDIISNSVRIRASQVMAAGRIGLGSITPGVTSTGEHTVANGSFSLLGLHLDKRFRVVFYSAGVAMSEQRWGHPKALYSAVLGRMHIRGTRKMYFYGMALLGSGNFPVPVPFIGGAFPVSPNWSFRATLPVSMELRYHKRKFTAGAGIRLSGFQTGIQTHGGRSGLSWAGLQSYAFFEQRLGRDVQVFTRGGYTSPGRLNIGTGFTGDQMFILSGGPFVTAGVRLLFGRSVWGKLLSGFSDD